MKTDAIVKKRYSKAAQGHEVGLCCPSTYDSKYLAIIPEEVLERDYGCGDPSAYVRKGETVLDLGSGGGKICFIAAQIVGENGRVIGIDINDDMLDLARKAQLCVEEHLGYHNITFGKGRIEDMSVDCECLDSYLRQHPITSEAALKHLEAIVDQLRNEAPLVANTSVDIVISNCVLNLVSQDAKRQVFSELHRVLKPGGRAIISDIVADQDIPVELQANPELWSGCYTGAMREDRFLSAFAEAGLCGITLLKRDHVPWHVIEDIEFRSMTVVAYKRAEGNEENRQHQVIFRGPFQRVEDDDGQIWVRGTRTVVSDNTFHLLNQEPYRDYFECVDVQPHDSSLEQVPRTSSLSGAVRLPTERKRSISLLPLSQVNAQCGPECRCD